MRDGACRNACRLPPPAAAAKLRRRSIPQLRPMRHQTNRGNLPALDHGAFIVDAVFFGEIFRCFFDAIGVDAPAVVAEGIGNERDRALGRFFGEPPAERAYARFAAVGDDRVGGDKADRFVVIAKIRQRGIVDFGFGKRFDRQHELFFPLRIAHVCRPDGVEQFGNEPGELFARNEVGKRAERPAEVFVVVAQELFERFDARIAQIEKQLLCVGFFVGIDGAIFAPARKPFDQALGRQLGTEIAKLAQGVFAIFGVTVHIRNSAAQFFGLFGRRGMEKSADGI